jgi:hypothetical protein
MDHYDGAFGLGLCEQEKINLVEYGHIPLIGLEPIVRHREAVVSHGSQRRNQSTRRCLVHRVQPNQLRKEPR